MEESNCFTGFRQTGLMDQISDLCSYSPWRSDAQSVAFEDRKRDLSSMGVREGGQKDQFPIGMRVLAVDDDPVCLKLLEALLLRCQYNVTTTNQAITALKMLRENRDRFDLVISDVHMPDMDGFKLLELVGLEMDLPVIMMSVNGETKTVMKGITHGACDYLIKPVRIEEVRNIWQHVVRRRKFDSGDYNNYDNREDPGKPHNLSSESEKGQHIEGSSSHSGKLGRKRKDQEEEDEDDEENLHENEDSSTQKKPRVVWSIELHRKFVAAVNQLGIDKAVPKRILELMNVDKLTRENVASHLQKYRLYLKRLSAVASQQANLVAAFGGRDPSYLHMASSQGFGNFQALSTSGQLPSLTSFQPSGIIRRPNSTVTGFQSLASSGLIQAGGTHTNTSIPLISKVQQIDRPEGQQGSLIQGIPTSLELEQLRRNRIQDKNHLPGVLSSSSLPAGGSTNTFLDIADSPLMSQAHKQQRDSCDLSSHSSIRILSVCSDPLKVSLPDFSKCSDAWPGGVLEPGYTAKALPTGTSTHHVEFPRISSNAHISQRDSNPLSLSNLSSSAIVSPQQDPSIRRDIQCQANYSNRPGMLRDSRLFSFSKGADTQYKAEEPIQNNICEHECQCNPVTGPTLSSNYLLSSGPWHQRTSGSHYNSLPGKSIISGSNASSSLLMPNPKVDKTTADSQLNYKDNHIQEPPKVKAVVSNGCMLDDIVGSMIKPERDEILSMDNDIGCDFYSLGTCM